MTATTDAHTKSRSPRRVRTSPGPAKSARRDYEAEFAAALARRGLAVLDAAQPSAVPLTTFGVVVRQFTPHLPDLRTEVPTKFQLDFAFVDCGVYCEIDGFHGSGPRSLGGHRTWYGFHRDRRKDRVLAFAGWHALRYGPADLATPEDVERCADEFIALAGLVRACGQKLPLCRELPVAPRRRRATKKEHV